jgi:hypothetical protein
MRIPAFKIAAAQAVGVFKGNFLETTVTFFEICFGYNDKWLLFIFLEIFWMIHLFVETLISFFFIF